MIIPIRAPSRSDSVGDAEWVMLELNGELLRPVDETMQSTQDNALIDAIKRRVELGSLHFNADVSELWSSDFLKFHQLNSSSLSSYLRILPIGCPYLNYWEP